MLFRLPTVRAKLTALVLLSVAVMLAALPVLSWLLHRQLIDEVDDRTTDARQAFQAELDDDIADLTLATRVLTADGATLDAITRGDAAQAERLARVFVGVYPDVDVLLVGPGGHVLAQVGCEHPPSRIDRIADLAELGAGGEIRRVVAHGCESDATGAPPAYVIATPIAGGGAIILCLPLDAAYLENARSKLGLALAFVLLDPAGATVPARTADFPPAALGVSSRDSTLVDANGRTWAVARFVPERLEARRVPIGVLAALDVTDVQGIIRRNLYFALAMLAATAAISVALGGRLARVMSGALKRVNVALKKVEQLEYVHVEAIDTGDELEDLAVGFNSMIDGLRERDKLRTTFGKYMTATVMEHLLAGKVSLGGESLKVTILFTDIRSFTTISERMDPQQLVALLNEYFAEMVGIVMQEGGVVDKYIGDAIMAIFGAPVPTPRDAENAVRAAVRMRHALEELNVRLEGRGLPPLRTGIGIHTGEVVAGNIGSEKRMEYTVIGDAVNLASRLETSTKDLGVNVAISEDTYLLTKDTVDTRPLREITVKGRKQPVMTYELLGLKGEAALPPDAAKTS